MARTGKEFQKLTWRGRPPFPKSMIGGGLTTLYLAADHLLKVETTYCLEKYRRFYLKDIQVLKVTRNSRAFWASVVLGLFTLVFLMPVIFLDELAAQVTFGIFSGIFALFLLFNLIKGPSCTTRIETSIGGEDIHSLARWWKARKVLARLLPLVREAQGGVEPASLAAQVRESQPPALSFVDMPARRGARIDLPEENGRPWMGFCLAVLLLLHAVSSALLMALPGSWGFPVGISLMLVAVIIDILLLIRPVRGCGRRMAGTVLGWFTVYGSLLYVLMIKAFITDVAAGKMTPNGDQLQVYAMIFRQGAVQDSYIIFLLAFSATVSAILGLLILFKMLQARNVVR